LTLLETYFLLQTNRVSVLKTSVFSIFQQVNGRGSGRYPTDKKI